MIAAPTSGAGKTTLTLGILRAMSQLGLSPQPFKSGPDYIDPQFHTLAAGRPSTNLDAWAMPADEINARLNAQSGPAIIEGAMGLFDGAGICGVGSAAELAKLTKTPVVLVIDCGRQSHSVAALVQGFVNFDKDINFKGLILNRVGSARHGEMLTSALAASNLPPVLGTVYRQAEFELPERHLGLKQPKEIEGINVKLDAIADAIAASIDVETLFSKNLAAPSAYRPKSPPPGQVIAVANDIAFKFCYTHHLSDWKDAGAEIRFFSPLNDEPVPEADFVFLPGGYPELHAGKISVANRFLSSLRTAAETTPVYGECGGYMVLGNHIVDAAGQAHKMAGLLSLETSFESRKRHLGYRELHLFGSKTGPSLKAHEFHYATTLTAQGKPLFEARDADGQELGPMGLQSSRVKGSFAHVIGPLSAIFGK